VADWLGLEEPSRHANVDLAIDALFAGLAVADQQKRERSG
jgi:hypothetical protein